ncbi:hypothetical protein AERO8C_170071 [Aeromonas veronii]|uniref:Uncharacterized protein n=1 Tax=Aeromonas veronii TaxID=654 RepID=A0A653L095_AERVE|nr:hypothetical protein AERO8C_170071 [Aeromonas veronii]
MGSPSACRSQAGVWCDGEPDSQRKALYVVRDMARLQLFQLDQVVLRRCQNGLLLRCGLAIPVGIGEGEAGIAAQFVPIAPEKVPVEAVEGATSVAVACFDLIVAPLAVVAHPLEIGAAAGVGFAAHQAAIGKLAHAAGVGQLDPLDGIHIDAEIPLIHLVRIEPRQQGKVAGHHQPLDMVGVAMLQRLMNGVAHAGHPGFTAPEETGQRPVGPEKIGLLVVGHLFPVEGTDKLAPAEDLANKPLHLRQRDVGLIGLPVGFGAADHLKRMKHFAVEGKRQTAVKQAPAPLAQGILIAAKVGQAVGEKMGEQLATLAPCDGPRQLAGIRLADGTDPVSGQHGINLAHLVGKGEGSRDWLARRQFGAVLVIKIPAPAKGLAALIEQHLVLLSQGAVEELHPAVGVALPAITGGEKMLALHLGGRDGKASGPAFQLAGEAPLVRALPGKAVGLMCFELSFQQAGQVGPAGALIQGQVTDAVVCFPECRREGAHGGKEGQHLLAMVAAVVGLLAQLRHQIANRRIRGAKPAVTGVQLIAENQTQLHHTGSPLCWQLR